MTVIDVHRSVLHYYILCSIKTEIVDWEHSSSLNGQLAAIANTFKALQFSLSFLGFLECLTCWQLNEF